jgi:D-glycero-alpha-D-manno-heptose-7-phosphate kinase
MLIRSRAPVRICDIGGWTDTHFAGTGAVLNISVSLYAHCVIRPRERRQKLVLYGYETYPRTPDNGAMIRALDLDEELEIDDVRQIEYDGNLDLLKAAVKRLGVEGGFDATVWADVPPGCGVGTSAAVAVAMIGGLSRFRRELLPPHGVAQTAQRLETEELGLECGVQDQLAAAYGGVCFMEVDYPDATVSRLDIEDDVLHELEERLVLAYVGQSRLSDAVHRRVIEGLETGDEGITDALTTLRGLPHEMKAALMQGDFDAMAEVVNANWAAQKQLHPSITNDLVDHAFDVAMSSGAVAGKANGAGGGGSITFLAEPGYEVRLREALAEEAGCDILPVRVSRTGVQSWRVPR